MRIPEAQDPRYLERGFTGEGLGPIEEENSCDGGEEEPVICVVCGLEGTTQDPVLAYCTEVGDALFCICTEEGLPLVAHGACGASYVARQA